MIKTKSGSEFSVGSFQLAENSNQRNLKICNLKTTISILALFTMIGTAHAGVTITDIVQGGRVTSQIKGWNPYTPNNVATVTVIAGTYRQTVKTTPGAAMGVLSTLVANAPK